MESPPRHGAPTSLFRSSTSQDHIHSIAEAMLRASISSETSSPSSTATRSSYAGTPLSLTADRYRPGLSPTASHRRVVSDSSSRSPRSPAAATTSRTRDRLRVLEAQLEAERARASHERERASQMRRVAEEQRGVAERLKREASRGLSSAEAERRLQDLKREMKAAGAGAEKRSTNGLFKSLYSADLLFLIDTTGSMGGHINAAKNQIRAIIDDINVTFLNEAEVRMAVVGYKDHEDYDNIQFLDFTTSVDQVRSFLDRLTAIGGGDAPEDVLGGLDQALKADWKQQTRCIIHIADAPPHGRELHDLHDFADDYQEPGSEPHGLTHKPLIEKMVALKLNYALLRINQSTDRMAYTIWEGYSAAAASSCKLHKSNRYYRQTNEHPSKASKTGGLLFEEAELGTAFSKLQHLVVKVVTSSASFTASRALGSPWQTMGAAGRNIGSALASVSEYEVVSAATSKTANASTNGSFTVVDDVLLETLPPRWGTDGWLDKTLVVEGFSPDILVHSANTLDDMMASDDNIKMSVTQLRIRMRSQPFAHGAMRMAYYASTVASTNRFVVKSPLPNRREGKKLTHVAEEMQCQALCKAFALEFNALLSRGKHSRTHTLDFIVTTSLDAKTIEAEAASSDSPVSPKTLEGECLSLEPYMEGRYVKYNSNSGYVHDDPDDQFNAAAQAFSHFTFERSRGQLLVSDLQGVGNMLTDPAVHTLDPERFKLSDTNLGKEGFKFFFATHICNDICRELNLKSNRAMIKAGPSSYKFRQSWPSMDVTACCSNKLCGRIVRLESGKRSDNFPGYVWCNVCFPQLQRSTEKLMCVESSPVAPHEFDVSRFFYESQGQSVPRRCLKHRAGEVGMPRRMVAARVASFGQLARRNSTTG